MSLPLAYNRWANLKKREEMQSNLSYRAYVYAGMAVVMLFSPIYLFFNRVEAFGNDYDFKFLLVGSPMLLVSVRLLLGTWRRLIKVTLSNGDITVANIADVVTKISLSELDGFETTFETSRGGRYEVLYLMKGKKSVVHLSQFHLANYVEIKKFITPKLKDLGYGKFSLFGSLKRYR